MRTGRGPARALCAGGPRRSALEQPHKPEPSLGSACVTKVVQEPAVRPHDLKNRDDRRTQRQHAWHSFPSAPLPLRAELLNVTRIFDPALGAAERTGGCSFSVGPQHH